MVLTASAQDAMAVLEAASEAMGAEDLQSIRYSGTGGGWQMSKLDDEHAVVLLDSEGSLNLIFGQASAFTSDPGRSLDLISVPLP